MYDGDRNLGIGIPGIGDIIGLIPGGIPGTGVSKSEAISGMHCPGPFQVELVKAALDASSATVKNGAKAIVLGNKGFRNELPGLSGNDTLIIARCLVWWAHGREDCKIGGDESVAITFLTSLMARAGTLPPEPIYQPPGTYPQPATAGVPAGMSMQTVVLIGGALLAGLLVSKL